jgi:tetratricopeptide (TPR) repeat protein
MRKLLLIIILLISTSVFSRIDSVAVDSIQKVLPQIKEDSNKVKAFIKLSIYFDNKDLKKAIGYLNDALAFSNTPHEKASTFFYKGRTYSNYSIWIQSDSCLLESAEIFKKINEKSKLAFCYEKLGINAYYQGNYAIAIDNYIKSLKLREKLGEVFNQIQMLNNIGTVYKEQQDFDKALTYYIDAKELLNQVDEPLSKASLLNNIGIIYKEKGNTEKALKNYKEAIKLFNKLGQNIWEANTYNNIALIFDDKREFPKAKLYYNKALRMFKEEEYDYGIILVSTNLAEMMNDLGDYNAAIRYAQISLKSAVELELKDDMRYAYQSLSRSYAKKENYNEAYKFHVLYSNIKDSILNEEKIKQVNELEAIYENEKKELEIDNLEKEKKLQSVELAISEEQKQKQKIISYSIAGGLALVLLFSIVVYNRLQITRKQKGIIEKQKIEVEEQKEIIEEAHTEITDSITYAKRIQDAILPSKSEFNKHLKNGFVYYQPKDIVAGDFYWIEVQGDEIFFAAADCTGHGVPGAMVSVVCHNALNRAVREFRLTKPSEILDKVRTLVIETFEKSDKDVKDGMDIALCKLNTQTNHLEYAGANNSLFVTSKNNLTEIKADKQPVGKYYLTEPFSNNEVQLNKGDTLYIFSDGYADQFGGPKGKKFMYKSFRNLLLSMYDSDINEQHARIEKTFNDWKGDLEQIDDVCVIGVRV